MVHFAYLVQVAVEAAVAPRSSKKEFRTSVILTEMQHKQVLDIAQANDASIAWVLRQAVDRYLEAQGKPTTTGKSDIALGRQ